MPTLQSSDSPHDQIVRRRCFGLLGRHPVVRQSVPGPGAAGMVDALGIGSAGHCGDCRVTGDR